MMGHRLVVASLTPKLILSQCDIKTGVFREASAFLKSGDCFQISLKRKPARVLEGGFNTAYKCVCLPKIY